MRGEEFEQLFEEAVEKSRSVLVVKAREYASNGDRMHNFKKAAALSSCTPEQALWGMLAKHLISLSDMVASDEDYDLEKWDEKLGDSLNYLLLLYALLRDGGDEGLSPQMASATMAVNFLPTNQPIVPPESTFINPLQGD